MTPRDQLQHALTDAIAAVNDARTITPGGVPIPAVTLPEDLTQAVAQAEAWLTVMGWPLPPIPGPGES